jgi:hypothetical protein
MTTFLNNNQLENVLKHKYVSSGVTLLAPYLNPYWIWCVNKLPMDLAPNIISIMGAICSFLAFAVLHQFSPDATQTVNFNFFVNA